MNGLRSARSLFLVTKVFLLVTKVFPLVTKAFPSVTKVSPSVTKVFSLVTKVFSLVTKDIPLVTKVCSPLPTPLLWNDNQQTYSFEVEGGGTNELTDWTHTHIVSFIVLDRMSGPTPMFIL